MKRKALIYLILVTVLVGFTTSAVTAQDRIYQKVKSKSVEIVPKETTETMQQNTEETVDESDFFETVEPRTTEPAKPPVTPEETVKEPVEEPALTQEIAQDYSDTLTEATNPATFEAILKMGAMVPGLGAAGELSFLPISVNDTTTLYTRAGIGYSQGSNDKMVAAYLSEIARMELEGTPAGIYGGIGVNFPVVVNGGRTGALGYNLILGADYAISLLDLTNEALYFEAGLQNSQVLGPDETFNGLNFLVGYKFAL